jgi:hypothetical protein
MYHHLCFPWTWFRSPVLGFVPLYSVLFPWTRFCFPGLGFVPFWPEAIESVFSICGISVWNLTDLPGMSRAPIHLLRDATSILPRPPRPLCRENRCPPGSSGKAARWCSRGGVSVGIFPRSCLGDSGFCVNVFQKVEMGSVFSESGLCYVFFSCLLRSHTPFCYHQTMRVSSLIVILLTPITAVAGAAAPVDINSQPEMVNCAWTRTAGPQEPLMD